MSDRAKINYAKAVLLRQYSGDPLTSGALVEGKVYRITRFVTGDDFANVGAAVNAKGVIFAATGTAPTTWTHLSRLLEFKLADLKAYSIEIFSQATDTITLTSTAFEGGQQSGDITFEKSLLGRAIEELLAEFDQDHFAAGAAARPIGITCVL